MFPTITHLINYLLGTDLSWSVPTFGVFVSLSFMLSYLTFRSEFARKEQIGDIGAFPVKHRNTKVRMGIIMLAYGLSGFLLGYKVWGLILYEPSSFVRPLSWIFSGTGHWVAGILLSLLFTLYSFYTYRWNEKRELKIHTRMERPIALMPTLVLWAAITGFIGAKIFNLMEDFSLYRSHSLWDMLRFSGLTFWGGLLGGAASYFYIGMRNGMHWRHLADIGSLGMLVAYGVGRLGCHLSGDGDWGIVATAQKPFTWLPDWIWSFRFPHNVIQQGEYIPGCIGPYCNVLPDGVYPTSLYESTFILMVFMILWFMRGKIRIPGLLFTIYLFVIAVERFLIEMIRVNYKYKLLDFEFSEAQLVSMLLFLLALGMVGYLLYNRGNQSIKNFN